MQKLARNDLYSLEQYSATRPEFRTRVMAHKKNRKLLLGDNATLYFEDRLTIQYQIQEMLRAERIFESAGIQEELEAYNPLIPDGKNWKATFMVEYPDVEERKKRLGQLLNIEDRTWIQVAGFDRVFAIADEDLERETDVKTSAVHFLRFELSDAMVAALKKDASLAIGIDHPHYQAKADPVPQNVRAALLADLD
jgi:hypothetical protein